MSSHTFYDPRGYGVCLHIIVPSQGPGDVPTLCGLTVREHA